MRFKRLGAYLCAGLTAFAVGCGKQAEAPAPETADDTTESTAPAETQVAAAPAETPPKQADEDKKAVAPDGTPIIPVEEVFHFPEADGAPLSIEDIQAFLDDPKNHETFYPEVPLGLDPIAQHIPEDNPLTIAKVELGRLLYFDPRLSRDNTVSCATCHDPARGWAQDTPVAAGIGDQKGGRNSPTVMNRVYGKTQFWDGRSESLEDQSLGPIQNPIEMGFTLDECCSRITESEAYNLFFEKVFGTEVTDAGIAKAIASFERMVITGGSPYDYYQQAKQALELPKDELEELKEIDPDLYASLMDRIAAAEANPLTDAAKRGMDLYFGKAECSLCHVGSNLTDELFYNIGVGMDKEDFDLGRFEVTGEEKDKGAFKTPSLRNIALTAPYMHDGSEETLMEVVEFYNKGGIPNPHLHERIKKLNLTKEEMEDLVAFMEQGLASPLPDIKAPRLPQ